MLSFIYVDLLTQRIFRQMPYDHRFIPAVLDGVLGMVITSADIPPDKEMCWSKFKGLFQAEKPLALVDKDRIDILDCRCESLEFLYRTIYLLRRHTAGKLPQDDDIHQEKLIEAVAYKYDKLIKKDGYLADFSSAKKLDYETAVEMTFFYENDRKVSLQQSEKLRLEWESIFLTSEDPKSDLQKFKSGVYLG